MSDSEMDEDLKRAIALSLEQPSSPTIRERKLIDLTISDDDDDLDAPVTTRFQVSQLNSIPNTSMDVKPNTNLQVSSQSSNTLFNGLNRKQMEEERIARTQQRSKAPDVISKKRKAPVSSPTSSLSEGHQSKFSRPESITCNKTIEGHQKKSTDRSPIRQGMNNALDDLSKGFVEPDSEPAIASSDIPQMLPKHKRRGKVSDIGVQFPFGAVKKTFAHGYPREDDIKIEEVLQPSTLELAVMSAFQIEPDWIASKILPTTKVTWVLQAKSEAENPASRPPVSQFLSRCESWGWKISTVLQVPCWLITLRN